MAADVPPPGSQHWFEPVAEHLGSAYLRYSFTKGTAQEVGYLIEALGLAPGMRVLDVGCGPGRHAHELARRGILCHGIDVSERFVRLATASAPPGATFERLDARALPFDGAFDAALSLCQGGFGLVIGAGEDLAVLEGMVRAIRPSGRVAMTAFNAYFQVRHHTEASWDADAGVAHERTEVRNEDGVPAEVDLWTACYTPRELRLLARLVGLRVDAISAVEPGAYGNDPPDAEHAELLVLATRP
jgi:SAM-dependent methyltransferase